MHVDKNGFNATAVKKAKIVYNFGLSECSSVKILAFLSALALTNKIEDVPTLKMYPWLLRILIFVSGNGRA